MKRYETYKNSGVEWIGEIPEGWEVLKLKYAFNILDYLRQPISSENRSRNNPIYDYYGASGIIDRIDDYNVDDKVLLIGEDGANLVMRNLPLIYKAEGKFWVNNHAHILKPKDGIDYDYMYYTLEMADYSTFITGSAQPKLSQENLCNVEYPIPSLSEQQQIASYLDYKVGQIDSSLAKIVEQIEDLKSYRQSVISEAVTKGLNPNAKMKDSGVEWIGEIPEGWEMKRLRFLCKVSTGDKDTINRVDDGLYPFYVRSPKVERINTYSYDGEAILMAGDGVGAGKVFHYANGKFDYHQRVYNIHRIEAISTKLLFYYMQSKFYNVLEQLNAKSTVDSVRLGMIQDFPVVIPSQEEQDAIVSFVEQKTSKIDSSIQALELQKSQLEDYKRSVISEAVTGKVDLRGWKQKCEQ